MTNQQPQQPIPASNAGMELIRIIATALLFGGLGAIIWAVSQGPLAEQASIVAAAAVMFFARQVWRRGVVGTPTVATPTGGASLGQSMVNAVTTNLHRMSTPLLLVISILVGFAFLAVREVAAKGLAPVIGSSAAVYASIAVAAGLSFLAQHLADRQFGPPLSGARTRIDWYSLPGEDEQQHMWRVGKHLTTNSDGWLRRCAWWWLVPAAMAYGVMALAVREVVTQALGVFGNLWVTAGVAMVLGSFITFPEQIPRMRELFGRKAPASARTAQPTAAATPQPAPVPQPVPAPEPIAQTAPVPVKRVIKKVVKKAVAEEKVHHE